MMFNTVNNFLYLIGLLSWIDYNSLMSKTFTVSLGNNDTLIRKKADENFVLFLPLLVTDKSGKPLDDASVVFHIEDTQMEMMENMNMMSMMENMSEAKNIGDGKYLVEFTPVNKGYYTMHTHAIPAGKSMMSMMNNHMDIGIIVN